MLGYVINNKLHREIYSMEVTGAGFSLQVANALYQTMIQGIREEIRLIIEGLEFEEVDGLRTLKVKLPFIEYPNVLHKKLDWDKLTLATIQLTALFSLLHFKRSEVKEDEGHYLSTDPQLLLIETGYIETEGLILASPMSIGFNKEVCEKLIGKYPPETHFPQCEEVMGRVYNRLSSTNRRRFLAEEKGYTPGNKRYMFMGSYSVKVRENGVPDFIVPGNCACLGANPDNFKYDFDMYSHNLDTPLQQMAMLAGVVSFWNTVLKPLMKEESGT